MGRLAIALVVASVGMGAGIGFPAGQAEVFDASAPPTPPGSFAPQLARLADGSVMLSWLEARAEGSHRFRASKLVNERWQPPVTIAEGVEFFANWADVPTVAEHAGVLFAHWLEKSGDSTYAYHVKVRASRDRGVTWAAPYIAHSDRSPTEHGFAAFFTRPDGRPGLTWLDGRNTAGASHDAGAAAHAGAMTLRAAVAGLDGTSDEVELDGRVCDCCPTAATQTPGAVIVAYRDRTEDEVRDISVVRLADGRWTPPVTLEDGWQIGGCPVNGPSLASRGRFVALAWFTGAHNTPAVKLAHSSDEGRTWGAPMTLSSGIPLGRVAVALTDDGATHVAWLDHDDGDGRLLTRRLAHDGSVGETRTVTAMKTDRASGYPRMIAVGNRLIYAWTDVGEGRSRQVAVKIED